MDSHLAELLVSSGYLARPELLKSGYNDKYIQRMLRRGIWVRVRNGAYAPADHWADLTAAQRHLVGARAAQHHAKSEMALSHVTSALAHGAAVWDLSLDEVHLTGVGGTAGRAEAGVRHHRGRLLADDVVELHGRAATSAGRAVLEVATMTDVEHALVVADSVLNLNLTTKRELRELHERMRNWPNTLHARMVVALADPGGQSPGETRLRYLCARAGLPSPQLQIPVPDFAGHVFARVDLGWPELGVLLEFDGAVKYHRHRRDGESIEDMVLREKAREDKIREITGCVVIRVVWADLYNPGRLISRIKHQLQIAARRAA